MTNYYINIHRNQAGPYDLLPEAHGFLRLRLAVGTHISPGLAAGTGHTHFVGHGGRPGKCVKRSPK